MDYLKSFSEMLELRGLEAHTIQSYKTYVRAYLDYVSGLLHKLPEDVSWQEMRDFLKYLQNKRHLADRTMNACISQLRFFTLYVLHKPWDSTQIPHRRFDSYLPYVPTQEEMGIFYSSIEDYKLKAVVSLLYSSGLRVGEVCALKYEDVSRKNMRVHIRHGKNRSDRYAPISIAALDALTNYWFAYGKPCGYLFPNPFHSDKPMSTFWVNRHIHEQEQKLGWEKRFTPHTFRHAFGTHLYENGVDLLLIKNLLGHKSINSTTIYVHLASPTSTGFVNPLDTILKKP